MFQHSPRAVHQITKSIKDLATYRQSNCMWHSTDKVTPWHIINQVTLCDTTPIKLPYVT